MKRIVYILMMVPMLAQISSGQTGPTGHTGVTGTTGEAGPTGATHATSASVQPTAQKETVSQKAPPSNRNDAKSSTGQGPWERFINWLNSFNPAMSPKTETKQ